MQPKSQFSSGTITHKASAPKSLNSSKLFSSERPQRPRSLNSSILTSSTTLLRPCSPRVSSAQALQPIRPQRPKAQQLSLKRLNYSTQAMQPKSQFISGTIAHKASMPKSPAAQFEELNYSTQVMQPKSQFNSGIIAHKASAPKSFSSLELFSSERPQYPRALVAQCSLAQKGLSAHGASTAQY